MSVSSVAVVHSFPPAPAPAPPLEWWKATPGPVPGWQTALEDPRITTVPPTAEGYLIRILRTAMVPDPHHPGAWACALPLPDIAELCGGGKSQAGTALQHLVDAGLLVQVASRTLGRRGRIPHLYYVACIPRIPHPAPEPAVSTRRKLSSTENRSVKVTGEDFLPVKNFPLKTPPAPTSTGRFPAALVVDERTTNNTAPTDRIVCAGIDLPEATVHAFRAAGYIGPDLPSPVQSLARDPILARFAIAASAQGLGGGWIRRTCESGPDAIRAFTPPPPAASPTAPVTDAGPWCGGCDETTRRILDPAVPEYIGPRCRACHPDLVPAF